MTFYEIGDPFNVKRPDFGQSRAQALIHSPAVMNAMSHGLPNLLCLICNCGQNSGTCKNNGLWLDWAKEGRGLERSSDSIQYYLGLCIRLPKDNERDAVGIEAFLLAMLVFRFRTGRFLGMKTNSIKTSSTFQAKHSRDAHLHHHARSYPALQPISQ